MTLEESQQQEIVFKLKDLTERMAQAIVDRPDQIRVVERAETATIFLELSVAPEEMGRVIGRKGQVANAMRTLLRASAAKDDLRVYLEVVEPESENDNPIAA